MLRQAFAVSLLVLTLLPCTAPFQTCSFTGATSGRGNGNATLVARPSAPVAIADDNESVADPVALRRWRVNPSAAPIGAVSAAPTPRSLDAAIAGVWRPVDDPPPIVRAVPLRL
jgi:hypothetical protein